MTHAGHSGPTKKHHPPQPATCPTFTDPRLCAAIVDRLTFGGNIIETGTVSYRLAHARAQRAGEPPSH